MPTFLRFLGVCSAALLSACAAAPTGEPAETHPVAAQAPALGKADSTDSADRECQLVLREVGRTPAGDGYAKQCAGGAGAERTTAGTMRSAQAPSPSRSPTGT